MCVSLSLSFCVDFSPVVFLLGKGKKESAAGRSRSFISEMKRPLTRLISQGCPKSRHLRPSQLTPPPLPPPPPLLFLSNQHLDFDSASECVLATPPPPQRHLSATPLTKTRQSPASLPHCFGHRSAGVSGWSSLPPTLPPLLPPSFLPPSFSFL